MARKSSEAAATTAADETAPAAGPAAVAPALEGPAPMAALPAPAAAQTHTNPRTGVAVAAAVDFGKAGEKVKEKMDKAIKTTEELVTFGQGNLEAVLKSGQIWTAGVQDIGKQVAASAQAHIDHTVATMKALAQAKSLKEAVDLQTSAARAAVETAVAETGKFTDASLKLAEQTLAPITARVTLAVEKFGRAV